MGYEIDGFSYGGEGIGWNGMEWNGMEYNRDSERKFVYDAKMVVPTVVRFLLLLSWERIQNGAELLVAIEDCMAVRRYLLKGVN